MNLRDLERQNVLGLTLVRPRVIYGPGDLLFLPKLVENLKSGKARIIGNGANKLGYMPKIALFDGLRECLLPYRN